jgi:hypothetical protein
MIIKINVEVYTKFKVLEIDGKEARKKERKGEQRKKERKIY